MPLERKTTALGTAYHHPVSYQLDGTDVLVQSLHSCPQASKFRRDLCIAARTDSGHILSIAAGWASTLQSGRSTLAVAGVFGAGKTRSLTLLLAWFTITWGGPQGDPCRPSNH